MERWVKVKVMFTRNKFGIKILLVTLLSIFLMPVSSGALIEIYINDTDMLNNEDDIIIQGGKDLKLTIRLSGDYKRDSENENLSIQSISISVTFLNDAENRGTTSGIPTLVPEGNDATINYEEWEARFRSTDPIFKDYGGDIQFAILMKNASKEIIRDEVLLITIQKSSSGESDSSGFAMPDLNLPQPIKDNLINILVGIIALIVLSVAVYTFVLAPEDTTADLFKEREAMNPLSKSLTGVTYESDLPGDEEDEEDDDDYVELEDEDDDSDFDESKLLAELTSGKALKSADEKESEDKPASPKKKVTRKITKKSITKKVVRKAAPKTSTEEPEVNMGKDVKHITCPACEKVHHIDKNTPKFICGCGRRIRV